MLAKILVAFSLVSLQASIGAAEEDTIDFLGGLLGALGQLGGVDTKPGCEYECPSGAKPIARPDHKPSHNGCGSYGLKVTSDFDFEKCCEVHDICYDTCGTSKATCDEEFKQCMKKFCEKTVKTKEKRQSCHANAGMYFLGAQAFGCDTFKESQGKACECPTRKSLPYKDKEL